MLWPWVVGVAMFSEGGTNDATRWRHRDDAPHSSHTNTQPQTQTHTQPHTTRPAHTVLTVSKWAAPRPGPRDTHRDPPPSVSSISVRAANDPSDFSITENAKHAKQAPKHGKHEKCEGV